MEHKTLKGLFFVINELRQVRSLPVVKLHENKGKGISFGEIDKHLPS